MEEQTKVPVFKAALLYGAIFGFVSIVISVLFNVLGLTFATWAGILSFLVSIGIMVYCLYAYRNEYLGGYAEYGKLVVMSLFIGIVASVLVTIYTYINIKFIDPDYMQKMMNFAFEKVQQNPRITDEMLDMVMDRMEKRFMITPIMIQTFIGGIVNAGIIGLIVSAFLKKQDPATVINN